MEDKRNLKCFFGLYQFVRIKEEKTNTFHGNNTLPTYTTVPISLNVSSVVRLLVKLFMCKYLREDK